ncbi:hypothetical protein E2C01_024167 [Portunus trituberculatus]|uniref:Uncharacterized protein n=1 Tax=Portunus trituberculatus TaxID=210409 RepID=A0A5B7EC04_PORTR|nr:hypothetical protein [Portunus trituberculatus]
MPSPQYSASLHPPLPTPCIASSTCPAPCCSAPAPQAWGVARNVEYEEIQLTAFYVGRGGGRTGASRRTLPTINGLVFCHKNMCTFF